MRDSTLECGVPVVRVAVWHMPAEVFTLRYITLT
jgi:hypothetical protein